MYSFQWLTLPIHDSTNNFSSVYLLLLALVWYYFFSYSVVLFLYSFLTTTYFYIFKMHINNFFIFISKNCTHNKSCRKLCNKVARVSSHFFGCLIIDLFIDLDLTLITEKKRNKCLKIENKRVHHAIYCIKYIFCDISQHHK